VTFSFHPARGLIPVPVDLKGPAGQTLVRLALDTGATGTMIGLAPLQLVGYDPTSMGLPISANTAGGVIQAYRLPVLALTGLGQTRNNFLVAARDLPLGSSVEGVLGLDFLRGNILTIDFIQGAITLTPGPAAGPTP
jgi:Aspartyl protease